jgi:hypothetical protein
MSVGLGSMKAKFNGEVEIDEPNRAKLKAHVLPPAVQQMW